MCVLRRYNITLTLFWAMFFFTATKIFDLTQNLTHRTCSLHSDTSWISQGLKHGLEKVDVYSNSWGAGKDFVSSSDLVASALEAGVNSV